VNQFEIALTAVGGALFIAGASSWIWSRIRRARDGAGAAGDACRAAFEQSSNGILMADVETLRIVDANLALQRTLGFSLDEVEDLLKLRRGSRLNRKQIRSVAERRVRQIEQKITELARMRAALRRLVHACHEGTTLDCPIIEALDR